MLTAISKDNDVGATIASGTANEVVTPSCARSMHMLVNSDQILQNIRMLNKSVRLQKENIHFLNIAVKLTNSNDIVASSMLSL